MTVKRDHDGLGLDHATIDAQTAPPREPIDFLGASQIAKMRLALGRRSWAEGDPSYLRDEAAPMRRHGGVSRALLVASGRVAPRAIDTLDALEADARARAKGVNGARIVHTERSAAFDAKNRYSLPDRLPARPRTTSADGVTMTLTEIAARISAHLMRFERDPVIDGAVDGRPQCATAYRGGAYVMVRYSNGTQSLTRAEATAYLDGGAMSDGTRVAAARAIVAAAEKVSARCASASIAAAAEFGP